MDLEYIRKCFTGREPGVIGKHQTFAVLVPFCMVRKGADADDDADGLELACNAELAGSDGGAKPAYEAELSLLYEVRASGIMQPGEVCFPGGHVEEGETPEECAVREACEELGVSPGDINVIAQSDTLYGSGSFTLYTFIGEITGAAEEQKDVPGDAKEDAEEKTQRDVREDVPDDSLMNAERAPERAFAASMLAPDPREVAEVFTVPVKVLMDEEPEHYKERMRPEIEPGFPYERVGIDETYPWRTAEYDIPVYDIGGRIIWGMTGRITERVMSILRECK